jgi:signal transduction histidine kinase
MRIVLGFAVVTITAGAISANTIFNMDRLDREIRVIRMAYLGLALKARDLAEKQLSIVDYLRNDLEGESNDQRARARLRRLRMDRDRLLEEMRAILVEVDPPEKHVSVLGRTAGTLQEIQTRVLATDASYKALNAYPPLSRKTEIPPDSQAQATAAAEALAKLRRDESAINSYTRTLEERHTHHIKSTAENLEAGSRFLRRLAILFGACAVSVNLLVAVLVGIALRPLRRLPVAAQRIADGDYGNRIEERGPAEVAELARELNIMARALEERERELVRSERLAAIGKMAAAIAHEVRNPLSSIALNTELLEEEIGKFPEAKTSEGVSLCRAITGEVDRLTAITETYLSFARLPKPKVAPEQLNRIVDSLADFERESMLARKVALETHLCDRLPTVPLDENQIRQALRNLLRNAVDAMSDHGGRVVLSTALENGHVLVHVADNGPGIDADLVPRLFDPFFSTKENGTGLGLALTQQIIRDHGGELSVETHPGKGSTFTVSLPVYSTHDRVG